MSWGLLRRVEVGIRVTDCRTFPCFPTSALQDGDVSPILRNVQGAAEKKYPLKIFGNISPTTENFKLKFTVCSYLRKITKILFNYF